ncbi:transcription factor ey2 [Nitzschia inconspicua]|uniref:Transcription factor ey2 n=1 Tax=Nitzschia inconspicua TaxID=303405 RepID=A0A9K3PXT7_9STRA|nr:transcription factor ey2 [Nitzschia inconspicua]
MPETRDKTRDTNKRLTSDEVKERNVLLKKMDENGDYIRIKHDLYAKLLQDDAWRERMLQQTRECVHRRGGVAQITFSELSRTLIQTGSSTVPESTKGETMKQIRSVYGMDP